MGVTEYFAGKVLLLTGVTGFLGKVIFEKVLRSLPNVAKIYILIRPKEGSSAIERFKKTIIDSPCFHTMKALHKNFDEIISKKVVPISGDVEYHKLNLSPNDWEALTNEVHIIVNSAASVDFNARLDRAIKTNIKGTLNVLHLAQNTKRLENFVHISTCYVNSDKRGRIEEKIYTKDIDPELVIADIEQIPSTQIESKTASIIGNYPNTYTFTKSMCEQILQKRKGDMTITIVRPSIIGCALREPFPGWVDSISAAGALYLLGGIGLIKTCKGDYDVIGDQIPVDLCSNQILVAAATYANSRMMHIVHSASSSLNPVTWGYSAEVVKGYWQQNPPEKRIGACTFKLEKNEKILKIGQKARLVPVIAFQKISSLVDSTEMKKKSNKLYKALKRAEQLSDLFGHFTMNTWIYLCSCLPEMQNFCTPQEKVTFNFDPREIPWKKYLLYFAWGLRYFILKENCEVPAQGDRADVLTAQGAHKSSTFSWLFQRGYDFKPSKPQLIRQKILSSDKVKNVIRDIMVNRSVSMSDSEYEAFLLKQADKHCDFIMSTYDLKWMRITGSIVHFALKRIYEKIVVDEKALEKIKNYDQKKNGPLIFMPTHRSYLDFILVSYIFYSYSIKCPHIVAAEDFLNMVLVHHLLRGSGALFIRRKKVEYMEIYWAVLYEYIQYLLLDEGWLEFFVEGTRSRYGKTLAPKVGILSIVTDLVFDNKLQDLKIMPITMSYERVVEGETFPFELLGEEKKKESLSRLLGAASILTMNFGRVYIEFTEPISCKEYINNYLSTNKGKELNPFKNIHQRRPIVEKLAYEITYRLNENLYILPTSIVASIILMNRKGISEESLIQKVEWLKLQILKRGGRIGGIDENSSLKTIKGAVTHLEHLIDQKKDIVHLNVSAKADYKNVLMLSYYRNMLIHLFWNEAIIACALSSFGQEMAWKEGITLERLSQEVLFVNELVSSEFQLRDKITKENLPQIVDVMIERGVLKRNDGKITVANDEVMKFLSNLVWPFVETYWIVAVYLFSLKDRASGTYFKKFIQEVQWFAESMYDERIVEFYEACSIDTIKNACSAFKRWKILNSSKKSLEKGQKGDEVIELLVPEDALNKLQDHIRKFLKNSFAKSVSSPIEIARKTMLIDYPFMAKM